MAEPTISVSQILGRAPKARTEPSAPEPRLVRIYFSPNGTWCHAHGTAESRPGLSRLGQALALPPLAFDRLMITPRTPAFDPGPLGDALPGPDWGDFAPARPGPLRRFLGAGARYKRQTAQARVRFEAAAAEHRQHESQRRHALSVAKAKYHSKPQPRAGPGGGAERLRRPPPVGIRRG
jgi:hypothetical protein